MTGRRPLVSYQEVHPGDTAAMNFSKNLSLRANTAASGSNNMLQKRKRNVKVHHLKTQSIDGKAAVYNESTNNFENFSEEEDENYDGGTFQKTILPVARRIKSIEKGPQTGEEYLLLVQQEKSSLPSVVSKECRVSSDSPGNLPCGSSGIPRSAEKTTASIGKVKLAQFFDTSFYRDFICLKQTVLNILESFPSLIDHELDEKLTEATSILFPENLDEKSWYQWCYGCKDSVFDILSGELSESTEEALENVVEPYEGTNEPAEADRKKLAAEPIEVDDEELVEEVEDPLSHFHEFQDIISQHSDYKVLLDRIPESFVFYFLRLSHRQIMRLLKLHEKWLKCCSITEKQYQWLYCLFLRCPEVLMAEEMAALRELGRKCILLYNNIKDKKTLKKKDLQSSDEEPIRESSSLLFVQNILSIIGEHYGQYDILSDLSI